MFAAVTQANEVSERPVTSASTTASTEVSVECHCSIA